MWHEERMTVLHTHLPEDMAGPYTLPGTRPVVGEWLRVDEAYGGQMALRDTLLHTQRDLVLACPDVALDSAREVLDLVLETLPALGFDLGRTSVTCPDGRVVDLDRDDPLGTLGRLVQCDLCLLHKPEGASEHLLAGAVLCFPANWRLHEKLGRPITQIHAPVHEYTEDMARRVQRLLNGVQIGRPVWRFNRLWYNAPDLFTPRRTMGALPVDPDAPSAKFYRSERQTLLRLPGTGDVLFAIHTYMLRAQDVAV